MVETLTKGLPISLFLIDPPYSNMMSKEKTGADISIYGKTATPFSELSADLGNMDRPLFLHIKCIIGQDYGFAEHIELILVNDGSVDHTEEICIFFQEKYPENITYLKKENGGVSSARNVGIEVARGDFLWFLDADDLLSPNAFRAVRDFFSKSKNQDAPFVCLRTILLYENSKRIHPLDFRFQKGERLIDLAEEPQCAATMMGDKCFRREAIGDIRFDESLSINEDTEFSYRVLMNTAHMYGVIPRATYFYRKHEEAITTPRGNEHTEEFLRCQFEAMKKIVYLSKEKAQHGSADPFVQYATLYLMTTKRYRPLKLRRPETVKLIHDLIMECEDTAIAHARRFSPEQKMLLFNLKYGGEEWQNECRIEGDELWLKDSRIAKIGTWLRVTLLNISELPKGDLEFTLKLPVMKYQALGFGEIYFTYDGKKLPVSGYEAAKNMDVQLFGGECQAPTICKVILSKKVLGKNPGVRFKAKVHFSNPSGESQTVELSMPRRQMTTYLPNGGPLPWNNTGRYIIKAYKQNMGYVVFKQCAEELLKANAGYMEDIRNEWSPLKFYSLADVAAAEEDIAERISGLPSERRAFIRRKEVWVIQVKPGQELNGAEGLYRHLRAQCSRKIRPYLALLKEEHGEATIDWKRLENEGFKLVDYGSREHMKCLTRAHVAVSLDANEPLDGSMAKLWTLYASMFRFDRVSFDDVQDYLRTRKR
mgnify:FL=1